MKEMTMDVVSVGLAVDEQLRVKKHVLEPDGYDGS